MGGIVSIVFDWDEKVLLDDRKGEVNGKAVEKLMVVVAAFL